MLVIYLLLRWTNGLFRLTVLPLGPVYTGKPKSTDLNVGIHGATFQNLQLQQAVPAIRISEVVLLPSDAAAAVVHVVLQVVPAVPESVEAESAAATAAASSTETKRHEVKYFTQCIPNDSAPPTLSPVCIR